MIYLSVLEALKSFRSQLPEQARLYVAGCSGEPTALAEAFDAEPSLADNVTFLGIWIPGVNKTDWTTKHPNSQAETIFLSADLRSSFRSEKTVFHPLSYNQSWTWLETTPLDGAVVVVSPPDGGGFVSLGVSADFSQAILARDDVPVMAIINHAMPSSPSSPRYPIDRFGVVGETNSALIQIPPSNLPSAFSDIGKHIAGLIENGDTLQFGLGNVQQAVLENLTNHKDLRIHAGMISDPLLDLIEQEAICREPGSITTGVAIGTDALYNACRSDKRVSFKPVQHTHAISTLASIKKLKAINSAIEVDLFGQANAEYINGMQMSGTGGLVDFLRGAAVSQGGRGIIALVSSAKKGTISRIVPQLKTPTVSIARADMDTVVTEHGVAKLKNKSIDERAKALINIAAPQFREQLSASWADIRSSL